MGHRQTARAKKSTPAGRPDSERRKKQAVRLGRVLHLLEYLQGGVRTIEALALEMGVCERTVHRDLAVLREADIACDYAADRGGYVLGGDWRFAVKWLNDEELLG